MSEEKKTENKYTIAIDFGTSGTGVAWAIPGDDKIYSDQEWQMEGVHSRKTHTSAAFEENGETLVFKYFGEEAETKTIHRQNAIASQIQLKKPPSPSLYLFQKFKMALYVNGGQIPETIQDAGTSKSLPTKTVFVESLRAIKNRTLDRLSLLGKIVKATDVTWVLTVPAIGSEKAKNFMRQVAVEAGLCTARTVNQLILALEPEAASLYCRSGKKLNVGSKYVVVDGGGGTVDVTFHQVQPGGGVAETHKPFGGAWGSTYIDKNFMDYMDSLFGKGHMAMFTAKSAGGMKDIMKSFIAAKKQFEGSLISGSKPGLSEPPEGKSDCEEDTWSFIDLPARFIALTPGCVDIVNRSDKTMATMHQDKLALTKKCMQSFFAPVMEAIVKGLSTPEVLRTLKSCDTMFLVGGFAMSTVFRRTMEQFGLPVIVPEDPCFAIVAGAVRFGLNPQVVTHRIMPFTYGFRVFSHRTMDHITAGRPVVTCKQNGLDVDRVEIYDSLVLCGDKVAVNTTVSRVYHPADDNQKSARLAMYTSSLSPAPAYLDQCDYLGELLVLLSQDGDTSRNIDVNVHFGGTEIKVDAVDRVSGQKYDAIIDFFASPPGKQDWTPTAPNPRKRVRELV